MPRAPSDLPDAGPLCDGARRWRCPIRAFVVTVVLFIGVHCAYDPFGVESSGPDAGEQADGSSLDGGSDGGTTDGGDNTDGGETPDGGNTPDGGDALDGGDTTDGGETPDGGEVAGTLCVTPNPLQFGTVSSREVRTLTLASCDGRPVRLTVVSLASSAEGFSIGELGPMPLPLRANDLDVQIAFQPTRLGDARTDLLVLHDGQLTRVGLEANAVHICTESETPKLSFEVRDMNSNLIVTTNAPRDTRHSILLKPLQTGPAATVTWSLPTAPPTSRLELGGGESRILYPELAGDYMVEAVARTSTGCASTPARFSFRATHPERIAVEMVWGEGPSDFDLHYVGPGGTLFDAGDFGDHTGTDVWVNASTQDWGPGGATDHDQLTDNDPTLGPTSGIGPGPEVLRQPLPENGLYGVYVHHFCSREWDEAPSVGPAAVRVFVWADRALVAESTRTLTQRDLWKVGAFDVRDNGIHFELIDQTLPKTILPEQGCTLHTE